MAIEPNPLLQTVPKPKLQPGVIEDRIVRMNGRVMVGADQAHIPKRILAASTDPDDVMRMADIEMIGVARAVKTDLAFPLIQYRYWGTLCVIPRTII